MTDATPTETNAPLLSDMVRVLDASYTHGGRAPEQLLTLAASLGWGANRAEFFQAATKRYWGNISDFEAAKALMMFAEEMFNQFSDPGEKELDICEKLLERYFFADVGPGLAGLCKNPDRAESVKAVFYRTPSAHKIPALALVALATEEQWAEWTQLDYLSAEKTLLGFIARLLEDTEANRLLSMALDTKTFAGVAPAPPVPVLINRLRDWSALLFDANYRHLTELALSSSFTPADYRRMPASLPGRGQAGTALFLSSLLASEETTSFYTNPAEDFSDLASVLAGCSLAQVAAVFDSRITIGIADQWRGLNPDMPATLLIAVADLGSPAFRRVQRLGLRDKVSLRSSVRSAQGMVDGMQSRIALAPLPLSSASPKPVSAANAKVRRRMNSSTPAPDPSAVEFPSKMAEKAMAAVEEIKGEYIRLSTEVETFIRMPAFLHRKFPPVDEFLGLLVAFQDAVYSRDNAKVATIANEVSEQFALAQEKACSKDGSDFIWVCDGGPQISSKMATLHRQSALAADDTPEGASAAQMMEETLVSLAELLGGVVSMQERLAVGSGSRQLPPAAVRENPAGEVSTRMA